MKPELEFPKLSDYHYDVLTDAGVRIGELMAEMDGYFVFYPWCRGGGALPGHVMRAIADKLDELNKPWDDKVRRGLST